MMASFPNSRSRARAFDGTIVVILLVFEVFQYSASKVGFDLIWGTERQLWSRMVAFALVAVDFAGLAKLIDPEIKESNAWGMLLAGWVLSAIGDFLLTWLVLVDRTAGNTGHVMVTSGAISVRAFTIWIPFFLSLLMWGLQCLLVMRLNSSADRAIAK